MTTILKNGKNIKGTKKTKKKINKKKCGHV